MMDGVGEWWIEGYGLPVIRYVWFGLDRRVSREVGLLVLGKTERRIHAGGQRTCSILLLRRICSRKVW